MPLITAITFSTIPIVLLQRSDQLRRYCLVGSVLVPPPPGSLLIQLYRTGIEVDSRRGPERINSYARPVEGLSQEELFEYGQALSVAVDGLPVVMSAVLPVLPSC